MAKIVADLVRQETTTTGTGPLLMGVEFDGYQTCADVLADGDTGIFAIQHEDADEWEVSLCTYDADADTLTRTTVRASSNSGSAVDFSAGNKSVYLVTDATEITSVLAHLASTSNPHSVTAAQAGADPAGSAAAAQAASDPAGSAAAAAAFAIQRANHTGSQAISTVSGLQTALDNKEAAGTTATHANLTAPHSATTDPTADRLVLRDASGRAAFADPSASDDAATKGYVDGKLVAIQVACSDTTSALTTGLAKATFRMPFAMTVTAVKASVSTAPTGAAIAIGINENGSSILSTDITIDAGSETSVGATNPPVISDPALAADAEITIDIDQVGASVAGVGLVVTIIGTRA
jgi:hypothetical protein